MKLNLEFVELMPGKIEEGTLYVSIEYRTVIHKCVCGCGNEVVTPLSPNDWELTFNGETVSLYPSIGNWSFDCKSHYWVINNVVRHAKKWDKYKIQEAREYDEKTRKKYYKKLRKK